MNFNSPKDVSMLFFGGTKKVSVAEPLLNELGEQTLIKSGPNRGKVKTKLIDKEIHIKGFGLMPSCEWKTKRIGVYKTGEEVLKCLANDKGDAGKIARLMLKLREKEKLLSTYYIGTEKFLHVDDCLHPNYQHVLTDTGRLSCNKPNVQNIPRVK